MKTKIYISVNSLPNTNYVLGLILNKLENSKAANFEINIIHDSMFNIDIFEKITKLNINFILGDDNLYEYPALRKLWLDSKNDDFYALYLHVKGASKVNHNELLNSIAWMEYMLFGLIDNLDLCINHMNAGADIVGSMWHNHFKGNFFWCKSSYVKTLLDPYNFTINDRFNAEYWISMPFDKHWFDVTKTEFNLDLKVPYIKNLFYLPIKNDLTDFLELKTKKYCPDLNEKKISHNIINIIGNYFIAYDEIYISEENFNKLSNELSAYLNYDAKINIHQ